MWELQERCQNLFRFTHTPGSRKRLSEASQWDWRSLGKLNGFLRSRDGPIIV
jgi:hypothetical protein